MKILLINPPFDYPSPYLPLTEPLSLGYLAAYLKKHHYEVEILDAVAKKAVRQNKMWHYGLNFQEIRQKIKEFNPDVVGLTCPFSLRIDPVLKVAWLIKKINRKIIVVAGGIHPTIFPKETVNHKEIDYVIIGEGEKSFFDLIKHLETKKDNSTLSIDGCAFKHKGKIKIIEKQNFIENLDSLPYPARDLIPMEFYFQNKTILYGLGEHRAASIITSRSCPYQCRFCSMYLSHGIKWRFRSAENVYGEIEELVKKYGVQEIFIMDDNFTLNKERVMKICGLMIKNKLKIRWNTPNGIRLDTLDKELIMMMKKSGCVNICVGIESGNEEIRNKVIGKKLSQEIIRKAVRLCQKANLPIIGFFILGLPGETEKTFKDTLEMIKTLPLTMITTSFFTPLPGTPLYETCLKNRYIEKNYWQKLTKFNLPLVETLEFNKKTLRKWEKQIYFEFLKSHFWPFLSSILSGNNDLLKMSHIKRFVEEKFST
jgi:anaerobic magnesium-protoporphyrin IX monomethyl ester cyclase